MSLKHEFLLMYELPSITEKISNDFLQGLIASYIAWVINRKLKRFDKRRELKKRFGSNN